MTAGRKGRAVRADGLPAGVYRHGEGYRFKYTDGEGRQVWSAVHGTVEAALAEKARLGGGRRRRRRAAPTGARGIPTPAGAPPTGETAQEASDGDTSSVGPRMSLLEYLRGPWLSDYRRRGRKQGTAGDREAIIDNHVSRLPFAGLPLDEVEHRHIQEWIWSQTDDPGIPSDWVPADGAAPGPAKGGERPAHEDVGPKDPGDTVAVDRGPEDGRVTRAQLGQIRWLLDDAYRLVLAQPRLFGIAHNPVSHVRVPADPKPSSGSLRRAATPADVLAVAALLPYRDLAPLWLMFLLGLRKGEAFGLRLRDIRWEEGAVWVRQQYGWHRRPDGSTSYVKPWVKTHGSRRKVYAGPWLMGFLRAYVDMFHPDPSDGDALLCRVQGAGLTALADTFDRHLRRAADRVGVSIRVVDADEPDDVDREGRTHLLPHDLRKAIASHLETMVARSRIVESTLSAYLGHKHRLVWDLSDTTRSTYTFATDANMRAAADACRRVRPRAPRRRPVRPAGRRDGGAA